MTKSTTGLDPLTRLSMQLSNPNLARAGLLKLVCEAIASSVPKSNRTSLWKFSDDQSFITCIALLTPDGFQQPEGLRLTQKDYPEYFEAIIKSDSVMASDARSHPDTRCFNKGYFDEEHIYSLMDYMFNNDFSPFGIICCESAGKQVDWSQEDLQSLERAARIVSIFSNIRHLAE
ncbi:hypothetical protein HMF8227_00888 [Saliniradius amylolyticus]|uniref:GAF domain-containing protein n=1 Tax=Saliniradius amylolyticus TaxID=2183582 RepID=A0A2S2E182_9ALTE|nr:GAF domain-containing protein [Saliniradius amylolyticus]AWL11383.1 hypothetical protein HMF8227_00888 [Saliniradius amylolyticus]